MHKSLKMITAAVVGAVALAACGGSGASPGSTGGSTGKTLIIGTDFPLQGAAADETIQVNQAIELYLEQIGHKVGNYTIELKKYDDSSAAAGKWDPALCTKNAADHVANANEIAVVGAFNSGCSKIEVPILNQDPNGPMLMVSNSNTNPGLTKSWDPGEPDKYYPMSKRNYARVVTTDDNQGRAAAQFMVHDLGVKKCYVLNDNDTYGQGVAQAFVTEAANLQLQILGNEPWDRAQPSYTGLFEKIKALGPDCIFLGGSFDNNGGQLVRDKVAVLGDNTAVNLMGPDGFTGFTVLDTLPESQGMYLSFPGLTRAGLTAQGGEAAKLLAAYAAKYGAPPTTSYALYGIAAVQVILAAIAKSDGTRKSVTSQLFSGAGVTIPADVSAIGKAFSIDTASGDVTVLDTTIEVIKDNAESFVKIWPITS